MRILTGDHASRKPRAEAASEDTGRPAGAHTDKTLQGGLAPADRIEISGEARSLHTAHAEPAAAGLDKTRGTAGPAVDPAQLEAIRARVKNGFYDATEVTRSIADRMLDMLGLNRPE